MPLTDTACKTAKPREDGKPLRLTDEKGMYLEVMPNGSKYWRLKYRFNEKEKRLALGVYPETTLKEARLKREEARKLLSDGIDPGVKRKTDKIAAKVAATNTFEALALEWHGVMSSEWSAAHTERVLASLKAHLFPALGKRPITEIQPLELLEVLRKVEKAGKLDTVNRLRERCSAIYRLAILTGRATFDPAAPLNEALKKPIVEPRKALGRDDLPAFLAKLETFDGTRQTYLLFKMMLLCFTRVGEMVMAEWSHIDWDAALWTIPASNRKLPEKFKPTAPPHLVPLSRQALEVLRELQAISGNRPYLFPNRNHPTQSMSPETLRRALHRLGYRGKADVHGFRSTASTILNEAGFNPDAIERQLSHAERNKVRAAYNRAEYMEERRRMMQWWADLLDKQQLIQG